MQAEDIRKQAEKAVTLLKALGSHNRLMIAYQLVEGERSVGELANSLEIGETVVSQHLSLMRKDGLVAARRDGRSIHYSLSGDATRRVLETLYAIYCSPDGEAGSRPGETS